MSNICAGIGRGQMTILEQHVSHHKHIHDLYMKAFENVDGITVLDNPTSDFDSNFWLTTILIDESLFGASHEDIRIALEKECIESRHLWKPMHMQPVFRDVPKYLNGLSEKLFNMGLCLPSGPYVSDSDVNRIVNIIKK